MTAEHYKFIWKGRRCVGRQEMDIAAKAMLSVRALRWEREPMVRVESARA
jgi:hypothetical protein